MEELFAHSFLLPYWSKLLYISYNSIIGLYLHKVNTAKEMHLKVYLKWKRFGTKTYVATGIKIKINDLDGSV